MRAKYYNLILIFTSFSLISNAQEIGFPIIVGYTTVESEPKHDTHRLNDSKVQTANGVPKIANQPFWNNSKMKPCAG